MIYIQVNFDIESIFIIDIQLVHAWIWKWLRFESVASIALLQLRV